MSLGNSTPIVYRVEISGWDTDENFFVEKTTLEWNEESGKKVYLRHPLRANAVVFVRLIDPSASGHTFPIAHQANMVSQPDAQGVCQVSLVPMWPAHSPRNSGTHPPAQSKARGA